MNVSFDHSVCSTLKRGIRRDVYGVWKDLGTTGIVTLKTHRILDVLTFPNQA